MTKTTKWGGLALTLLLALGVAWDPYTFFRDASDMVIRAPWWQLALAIVNLLLVAGISLSFWLGKLHHAFVTLAIETLYILTLNIAFVFRDGIERYLRGIGAQEFVSLFLALVGLRVVLLLILYFEVRLTDTRLAH